MRHEMVNLFDENGRVIGSIDKEEAHSNGALHDSIHVWVVSEDDEITVQKRAEDKDFYPNVWDVSFAGHVGADENPIDTVVREGKEEINIDVDTKKLKYICTLREELRNNGIISNEFVHVYILRQNYDTSNAKLQVEEVKEVKEVTRKELFEMIKKGEMLPHTEEFEIMKRYL